MQSISALREISPRYQAILSDIWGVVHNGVEAHKKAISALVEYRTQGGHVVLITNAARPDYTIQKMLDDLDVPRTAYDAIATSGDVTRDLIKKLNGAPIHVVGPDKDMPLFDGLTSPHVGEDEAQAVVVTGLHNPYDTPEDYMEPMRRWRSRELTFVCANPDKVVEVGDIIEYCPGALADIYSQMGGKVEMAGKPYQPIYDLALSHLMAVAGKSIAPQNILAIGDNERTDARGAAAMGLDLLFITGSIHAHELDAFGAPDAAQIARLLAPTSANCVGYQSRLA